MKKYLLGLDVGTTGSKAIIFDTQGNVISNAYEEYACIYPKPGWVEQDADMLARATLNVCKESMERANVGAEEILSVSVSAQRCCLLLLDSEDKVLKMISWLDNRPTEEVAEIDKKIGANKFYEVSGMPLGTTWLLPKIMWVRKNEPEIWSKTAKVVQLHDFILKSLGADDYYSDEPDSAFWGFWNTDNLCWDEEMIKTFDIPAQKLPKVKPSGTKVGQAQVGVLAGVDLCVGAGDQNCAAIGAGVVKEGRASVSLGTGGLATVFSAAPFRDKLGKTMVTNSPISGCWQIEGLQNGAAGVYRWFRDEIATLEKEKAEQLEVDAYQIMGELLEQSAPGANGLLFLPFLASAGSPRYDEYARGSLLGISFAHTRADIARAVIEGITMEQKDILTSMRETGRDIKSINIMGGATNSPLWNQTQADMYKCPTHTLKIKDAAVLGAAMCAGLGAGVFTSFEQAAHNMVNHDKTYTPIPKNEERYDEMYGTYCAAYDSLAKGDVFKRLCNLQLSLME